MEAAILKHAPRDTLGSTGKPFSFSHGLPHVCSRLSQWLLISNGYLNGSVHTHTQAMVAFFAAITSLVILHNPQPQVNWFAPTSFQSDPCIQKCSLMSICCRKYRTSGHPCQCPVHKGNPGAGLPHKACGLSLTRGLGSKSLWVGRLELGMHVPTNRD